MRRITTAFTAIFGFALIHAAAPADGQTTYERRFIGSVPGTTTPPGGGMAFLPSNPNKLLVGGNGQILAVDVVRDGSNHVTGFTGTPTLFATTPGIGNNGMGFGPGGVLFYAAGQSIGQIKPGSTTVDKTVNLASISGFFMGDSMVTGTANDFSVSPDLTTRGQIIVRYSSTASNFYETALTPDGNGTYDISSPTFTTFFGGVLNYDHVPTGFPLLPANAAFVTIGNNGGPLIYNTDANDRPAGSSGTLDTSPFNAGAATFDPVTGDYFIVHLGTEAGYHAYTAVPEPAALALLGLAAVPMALRRRARQII